jgi:hypothetical protein
VLEPGAGYVADGFLDGVAVEDVITEETRMQAVVQVRELLQEQGLPGPRGLRAGGRLR